MAALIEECDWSASSLGPIDRWPTALRNAIGLMLPAGAEIVLFWGPEFIAFYNDAYAPSIGDKHPRALGRPAREGWAELWDDLRPLLAGVRESGETFSDKDRAFYIERHGYGEEVYFDLSYSAVPDDDGSVGGVLCIVSETTERVRASRRIGEENARLSQMFDSAPGFMAVIRPPGHVVEIANASYRDLIGDREVIGRQMIDFLPEAAARSHVALLDQVTVTGRPYRGTGVGIDLLGEDGAVIDTRFVDFVYQPVADADGKVSSIFVEGNDVTDRIRASQKLMLSEESLRLANESAELGTWDLDLTTDTLLWSERTKALFGISPNVPCSMEDFYAGLHPEDAEAASAAFAAAIDPARRAFYDVQYRTVGAEDGVVRWVAAKGRGLFDEDGVCVRAIGSVIDISDARLASEALERGIAERTRELADANAALKAQIAERERVEEELHQLQRLEAVGQLTSGVAHDFNNLLTVVLGNVGMIERTMREREIDERTLRRIEHVRTAAERGAALTAQLLAFSRRQRLESKATDLNATVQGMRGLLESTLGSVITIETRLKDGLWSALVDPTQIELILLNLAINARDAMQDGKGSGGGRITIETANITVNMPKRPEHPPEGDHVMVALSDTGSGMTDDVLARAFEPFFTTKDVGHGSGLGLAQVFGFAKQSGGGVHIDTRPGAGTTVRVYLPRTGTAPVDVPWRLPPQAPAIVTDRHVLVVDDDAAVRAVTTDALAEIGCVVFEAEDGESALAMVNADDGFELAVIDFAMPGMNGADLAHRLRVLRPELKILFVTGFADLDAIAAVSEHQIVQKPFDRADLQARVGRLIER